MSYSVSLSGHGVDAAKAKAAFSDFVKALDEATAEDGTKPGGQISGGERVTEGELAGSTRSFSLSAQQARDGEEGT